ncbi:sensor histidine kinase [Pseudodesulfovibrio tunisiensis]|uniref:sensor histidine kinase n=1 Tax=Pseudodesulfovibrio tunisiensis TaxID=463192 RepID=UPI001FB1A9E6|nr:PAS domain-containing sensor histidine kinase [Pseudodesulfovibrio tunisiensis]
MSEGRHYQSITRNMMLTIIVVSFLPLLAITLIAGYQYSVVYKKRVVQSLSELVLKHEQAVDTYLDEKLAQVQVLVDIMDFDSFRTPQRLAALHRSLGLRHGTDFVDISLISEDGVQQAYVGPFKLGKADYSSAPWFKEVMKRGVCISDVFLGLRGVPHFIVAVKFSHGGREWVLRTTLDFVDFNEMVEHISIGETGQAFIINRQGQFQTRPRTPLNYEIPFLLQLIGQAGYGDTRAMVRENPVTERETIFVATELKRGDWALIYQQEASDAFSELNQTRNLAIVVMLLGCLAIVITAHMITRRIVSRIRYVDQAKDILNEQVVEAGKLASVGELAAGIAHEINNPVAIMVEEAGWIQDILKEGIRNEDDLNETARALAQIRTQGARCRDITHKLLSFARKIDPTAIEMQLNLLIREMESLSEQRARFASVHIETELDPALPSIMGSPSEMQQVLINLINNAIDAMEKKGGDLRIATRKSDDDIVLTVEDQGEGIPKANLKRLFDPFFTTKPVGKGTGLGLSIIYGIVRKMGGDITVDSTVGKGTAFTITLPSADKARREQE